MLVNVKAINPPVETSWPSQGTTSPRFDVVYQRTSTCFVESIIPVHVYRHPFAPNMRVTRPRLLKSISGESLSHCRDTHKGPLRRRFRLCGESSATKGISDGFSFQ